MFKILLLLSFLYPLFVFGNPIVRIKGAKIGNWWVLGETVKFIPASPKEYKSKPTNKKITGMVYDSMGKKIAEQTVNSKTFAESGWNWKPSKPGFYKLVFYSDNKVITNSYNFSAKISKKQYSRLISREYNNFVVAPEKTPIPSNISPQFGMSPHDNQVKIIMPLSRLIGFNGVRYHMVHWDNIEKQQGKYNFKSSDLFMNQCKQYGYEQDKIVLNVYGTPYWASSIKSRKYYIVPEYVAAPPQKISYWTNFLTTLAKRYPKVNKWELWNEPSLPGRSLYWSGTPKEFVKMYIAGYKAIKKVNPSSEFYLYSGLGTSTFFKNGAAKYADYLGVHGTKILSNITGQNKWLKEHGMKAKPWVNMEWHIALLRSDKVLNKPDSFLAKNMIVYFARALSLNGKALYAFCMTNNVERETLQWLKDKKIYWNNHSCGFFRKKPYIEPRLLAYVWHNFTTCFKGNVTFKGDYTFGKKSKQIATVLSSDAGPVLFFWNSSNKSTVISQKLFKAIGKGSKLFNWESRKLTPSKDFMLQTNMVYWIKSPEMKVIEKWKNLNGSVLVSQDKTDKYTTNTATLINGVYHSGSLFDKKWNILNKKNLKWLNANKYVSLNSLPKPKGFKAKFAIGMNKTGLDLLVAVKDDKHVQNAKDRKVWNGDSLQFSIDPTGNASHKDNRIDFSAALKKNGAELWKEWAPDLGGDLPEKYTYAKQQVKYGKIKITKIPGGLLYKIHISEYDLHPYLWNNGKIRFSLLLNNNDGKERNGYLEWSSGIGASKEPLYYGTLTVAAKKKKLLNQSWLRLAWGSAVLEKNKGILKVINKADKKNKLAAVITPRASVTPGAAYDISYSIRGNRGFASMIVLYNGKTKKRFNYMKAFKLSKNWMHVKKRVVMPFETQKIEFFMISESTDTSGWFEVKDFKMIGVKN